MSTASTISRIIFDKSFYGCCIKPVICRRSFSTTPKLWDIVKSFTIQKEIENTRIVVDCRKSLKDSNKFTEEISLKSLDLPSFCAELVNLKVGQERFLSFYKSDTTREFFKLKRFIETSDPKKPAFAIYFCDLYDEDQSKTLLFSPVLFDELIENLKAEC